MRNISLQSIKEESVRSIFTSIASRDSVSRADVSGETDLSLVTVGKVADALLEMNVIYQIKEVSTHAGRRARLLSVNDKKYAVILDLTHRSFGGIVLNLRLNFVEMLSFSYDLSRSYAENLQSFFAETSRTLMQKYETTDCYGVGVSLPGTYDPTTDIVDNSRICELNAIPLGATLQRYFPDLPLFIDSSVNAAARSNISQIPDYRKKNILYWFIGEDMTGGAFVVKGEVIVGRGSHFCDFGSVRDSYGRSLAQKIALAENAADYARIIALDAANVIRILAPHVVILECAFHEKREENRNLFLSALRELLIADHSFTEDSLPEFIGAGCKVRQSHRGIAMRLREMWIDRLISAN